MLGTTPKQLLSVWWTILSLSIHLIYTHVAPTAHQVQFYAPSIFEHTKAS